MYSLLNQPNVQRAILDELLPDWRQLMNNGPVWDSNWIRATGNDRTTAWRWRQKARAIVDLEELSEAA